MEISVTKRMYDYLKKCSNNFDAIKSNLIIINEVDMELFREDCIQCNECQDICPVNCIEIHKDGAYKDHKICIDCRKCDDVCPVLI